MKFLANSLATLQAKFWESESALCYCRFLRSCVLSHIYIGNKKKPNLVGPRE